MAFSALAPEQQAVWPKHLALVELTRGRFLGINCWDILHISSIPKITKKNGCTCLRHRIHLNHEKAENADIKADCVAD